MNDFIEKLLYIFDAEEHRPTRVLISLTCFVFGWCFSAVLHGLGVAGF